jgi:acetylglutamate kinase
VNDGVLRALMEQRFVPVIASIAIGDDGQAYNVIADMVAAELAVGLSAQKLVYMNDVPGLIGPDGHLLPSWEFRRPSTCLPTRTPSRAG